MKYPEKATPCSPSYPSALLAQEAVGALLRSVLSGHSLVLLAYKLPTAGGQWITKPIIVCVVEGGR